MQLPLCHSCSLHSTLGIPLVPWGELSASGALSASFDVVVDALFGFSFSGTSRPPFDEIIKVRQGLVVQLSVE